MINNNYDEIKETISWLENERNKVVDLIKNSNEKTLERYLKLKNKFDIAIAAVKRHPEKTKLLFDNNGELCCGECLQYIDRNKMKKYCPNCGREFINYNNHE